MILSMPDLPPCPGKDCDGWLVLEVDGDSAAEVCTICGTGYWPQPPVGWRQQWKRRVRSVAAMPIPEELRDAAS